MENKVILITGASGGMGKHLVSWFKEQDCRLILHYHDKPIDIEETESIRLLKADLCFPEQIEQLAKTALTIFGRIDVLVNNAGVSKSAMSWKMTLDDWKETMAINLDAPFLLSKAIIPSMRAQNSGCIINISSVVAQSGAIGTAAYAASKAGLIGLTKTLSKELAPNNITVNTLALGYFNTGMIEDVPAEIQETIIQSIPLKKLGEPQTVCKAIEWLISDEASYVTGQVINLNGGMYA
jgi:NAD(P)-dependent dehydrogenase (short-subunit alcohol dehydrogenase family)